MSVPPNRKPSADSAAGMLGSRMLPSGCGARNAARRNARSERFHLAPAAAGGYRDGKTRGYTSLPHQRRRWRFCFLLRFGSFPLFHRSPAPFLPAFSECVGYLPPINITFSRPSFQRDSGRYDRRNSVTASILKPTLVKDRESVSASNKCSRLGMY